MSDSDSETSLVSASEMISSGESISKIWKTESDTMFFVTENAAYESTLSETSGGMFCLPFSEMSSFNVSHDREDPNYSDAFVVGISGVIMFLVGLLISGISPSTEVSIAGISFVGLGGLTLLIAVIMAVNEAGSVDETTNIKITHNGTTFTVDLEGIQGEEVCPHLSSKIAGESGA
jgi:hypothetical protein